MSAMSIARSTPPKAVASECAVSSSVSSRLRASRLPVPEGSRARAASDAADDLRHGAHRAVAAGGDHEGRAGVERLLRGTLARVILARRKPEHGPVGRGGLRLHGGLERVEIDLDRVVDDGRDAVGRFHTDMPTRIRERACGVDLVRWACIPGRRRGAQRSALSRGHPTRPTVIARARCERARRLPTIADRVRRAPSWRGPLATGHSRRLRHRRDAWRCERPPGRVRDETGARRPAPPGAPGQCDAIVGRRSRANDRRLALHLFGHCADGKGIASNPLSCPGPVRRVERWLTGRPHRNRQSPPSPMGRRWRTHPASGLGPLGYLVVRPAGSEALLEQRELGGPASPPKQ